MSNSDPRVLAIHHIVHEYANLVSSAEMVLSGKDIYGNFFEPPINTHVSHAFYLNCRKLADFFQNKVAKAGDDILAKHFVTGFTAKLPVSEKWRQAINKQLAHVTYSREVDAREITRDAQKELYKELRDTWRDFRKQLPASCVADFEREVLERKQPNKDGELSEFRLYDLD